MTVLPGARLQALISSHTGDISGIRPSSHGHDADITAVVECEKGPVFVKAIPNRPGGKRDSLLREELINPFVRPLSPALLWRAEDAAWIALGFEVVEGRAADFTPGSPDLPTVVETLNRIGNLPLPAAACDWTETRWDRFTAEESETALLRGDTLLYTDLNPGNILIGERGVWAVDWAWPTRGAGFIDPACLVVQLIAAGHGPAEAQAWAQRCDAWTRADPEAVDVFAAATVRMHRTFAQRKPDAEWLTAMAAAAESWAEHRSVPVPP